MNNAIFIDTGTTNTRVWLMHGDRILAHQTALIGVRDSAREGSTAKLHAALRDLIQNLQTIEQSSCVVAAGMITSALGLMDVPHIAAPAGLPELAAATRAYQFPDVTDLPVYLVPGIRSGAAACDFNSVSELDVMRGEETLCAGLVELGLAPFPGTVLNLGSHWKAIQIDEAGRVQSSVTSLTGELIFATQTNTILASAVPHERPDHIAYEWAAAGMREQQQSGLARALFCVRLLEQKGTCSAEERLSYLVGAYLASDFDGLRKRGLLTPKYPVLITGGGALANLWEQTLQAASIASRIVTAEESEAAMLTALRAIVRRSGVEL
ncbi:MAG: 2-dehydro-3-deoxygalactonokinase [Blastocatellia bacterium]|nr:2-dehydro-3-deoxygalactonokinase [Blastocatellia bacterium]